MGQKNKYKILSVSLCLQPVLPALYRVSLQDGDAEGHSARDPAHQPGQRGAAAQVPRSGEPPTLPLHGPTPSGAVPSPALCHSRAAQAHVRVHSIHVLYIIHVHMYCTLYICIVHILVTIATIVVIATIYTYTPVHVYTRIHVHVREVHFNPGQTMRHCPMTHVTCIHVYVRVQCIQQKRLRPVDV